MARTGRCKGNAVVDMMTEKEKFLQSFEAKKKAGLRYVNFFVFPGARSSNGTALTEEEICAEINRMYAAPDLLDQVLDSEYRL